MTMWWLLLSLFLISAVDASSRSRSCSVPPTSPSTCAEGWTAFPNGCFIKQKSMSFISTSAYCKYLYGGTFGLEAIPFIMNYSDCLHLKSSKGKRSPFYYIDGIVQNGVWTKSYSDEPLNLSTYPQFNNVRCKEGSLMTWKPLRNSTGILRCKNPSSKTKKLNGFCAVIDGSWSNWGSYGSCSASCGEGTQARSRSCSNPFPTLGGKPCPGSSTQTQSCNAGSCPCTMTNVSAPGVITSPNYPSDYPDEADICFYIDAPQNNVIGLTFTNFDLELSDNCNYDSVKIFDGFAPSSPILANVCGRQMPTPAAYTSTGNNMLVRFKTDGSVNYSGFRATLTFAV